MYSYRTTENELQLIWVCAKRQDAYKQIFQLFHHLQFTIVKQFTEITRNYKKAKPTKKTNEKITKSMYSKHRAATVLSLAAKATLYLRLRETEVLTDSSYLCPPVVLHTQRHIVTHKTSHTGRPTHTVYGPSCWSAGPRKGGWGCCRWSCEGLGLMQIWGQGIVQGDRRTD